MQVNEPREWWIVWRNERDITIPMALRQWAEDNAREYGGEVIRVREVGPR